MQHKKQENTLSHFKYKVPAFRVILSKMMEIKIIDKSSLSLSLTEERKGLPKEVLSHSLSYALEEDKENSLLAYLTLFNRLKKEGIPSSPIKYTDRGKPYRDNGIHFSFSHSKNRIAVRISSDECGIDIQEIENKNFDPIAKRILSDREYSLYLSSLDKPLSIISGWVRKEAYLKRKGTGILSLSGLKEIDLDLPFILIKDKEGNRYCYSYTAFRI